MPDNIVKPPTSAEIAAALLAYDMAIDGDPKPGIAARAQAIEAALLAAAEIRAKNEKQ